MFPWAIEADGRFVCRGNTNHCVLRVNLDRTLDSNFLSPAVSTDDLTLLNDIQPQPDGKFVVGCYQPSIQRSQYAGINNGMFRLNQDGSDDSTFQFGASRGVLNLMALSDGKILVNMGTLFQRCLTNGSPDPTFNSAITIGSITQFAQQPDGKIVIAGTFSKIGGFVRPGLARLQSLSSVPTVPFPVPQPKNPSIHPDFSLFSDNFSSPLPAAIALAKARRDDRLLNLPLEDQETLVT